jgi:hypothetical protein
MVPQSTPHFPHGRVQTVFMSNVSGPKQVQSPSTSPARQKRVGHLQVHPERPDLGALVASKAGDMRCPVTLSRHVKNGSCQKLQRSIQIALQDRAVSNNHALDDACISRICRKILQRQCAHTSASCNCAQPTPTDPRIHRCSTLFDRWTDIPSADRVQSSAGSQLHQYGAPDR